MAVHKISEPHHERVRAALEDLLALAQDEGLSSFMYIVEDRSRNIRIDGVVGRFRSDPLRLLGLVTLAKAKIAQVAARMAPRQ
jgi:hypothetical protein